MSRSVDILNKIRDGETYNLDIARSRAEEILIAICNNTSITLDARSRYEELLLCIKNNVTTTLAAQTRLEEILINIINGTLDNYLMGKNLFNKYSNWNVNASMSIGGDFPANTGGNRYTYFMIVEPNKDYTISFKEIPDRLVIVEYYTIVNPLISQSLPDDNLIVSLQNANIPLTYSFTTNSQTKMIGVYYSLEVLPKEMKIEIGSSPTNYSECAFITELEQAYYDAFGGE